MIEVPERLIKRDATWYYQRRVPLKLVPILGKRFIKISLKTKDKALALKMRALKDLESDTLFANAAAGALSSGEAVKKVELEQMLEYVRRYVERDDTRSAEEALVDPAAENDREEMIAEAEQAIQLLEAANEGDRDQVVRSSAKSILKHEGAADLALTPQAADFVRRGLLELYRRKLGRFKGSFEKQWYDSLFAPDAPSATSLGTLQKLFLEEREEEWKIAGTGASRRKKIRAFIPTLVEIVGPATPVASIGDAEVQKVRIALAKLPKNRTKHYLGLSVSDAIELAQKEGRASLGPTTQRDYLAAFSDLLQMAVRRKLIAGNPALGVRPITNKQVTAEDARKPFTKQQMARFFSGAFYQQCAPGHDEPYEKADREWRFWMPLLMAFNGARPNEIAQLTVADFRTSEQGHPYIDLINDESDEGEPVSSAIKVKTASSRRKIPVHPELVKVGLLRFVQRRREEDGASARLFPTLRANSNDNFAHYACKRFNERFLKLEINRGARQTFYSFRHNVREALRRVGAPREALRAIAGWSEGYTAVSDQYGDPNNPDHYVEWVAKIEYEGIDLAFLYDTAGSAAAAKSG